jgi:translation initiation factor IF-1
MRTKAIIATIVLGLLPLSTPAFAQPRGGQSGGALGGILDTLGGLLGTGSRTLHGTVVLTDGYTVVLRAADRNTYRVDVAGLDPSSRTNLTPGQMVTVTARGGGTNVLTATRVQADADTTSRAPVQRVSGTIQESGRQRILFKTGDGLVLPVDVSRVHGLPYLAINQPATLYYEQGPKQEIEAVWLEPGAAQPSALPSTTSVARSLQGKVETIGVSTLTLQTSDGKTVTVDTSGVDRQSVASVRPGDAITITGAPGGDGGKFVAQSIRSDR